LRATPNIWVFRPADSVETAECYELALNHKTGPSVLALSRQALPVIRDNADENKSACGGYVIYEPVNKRQATLIATGSEVSLALKAKELLLEKGIDVAVVSLPCVELFEKQTSDYQNTVLGREPRIIIEAGSTFGWYRWLQGYQGTVIGIDTFGASGKGNEVMVHFGFTPEKISETVLQFVK
jgi:transketolase